MDTVTQTDRTATERQRRRRALQREAATAQAPLLLFETADWQLFLRKETLPQKAGCSPNQIPRIVLKEITDNALDTGSTDVTIELISGEEIGGYRVTDHGPGIAPEDVPKFFAVNRPLLSSKLKRQPLRGMLGNGLRVVMGAVAAYAGTIAVTSRGRRMTLAVDNVTGQTRIVGNETVRPTVGTTVEIMLPCFTGDEKKFAELSLMVAATGVHYAGPSQPSWYGSSDLRELFARVQPPETTVAQFARSVFELTVDDDRVAADLESDAVVQLHHELCALADGRRVPQIGCVGDAIVVLEYAKVDGVAHIGEAVVPFCVECWADCYRADRGENTAEDIELLLNRSPSIAPFWVSADSDGLFLQGCGLNTLAPGKRANYELRVSLITPFVRLMNDGKTPFLGDFSDAIRRAVQKAAGSAYRAMIRPRSKLSIKDAAWQVMPAAYLLASGNFRYPANARQIMYAARPDILRLAGVEKFSDAYFTGTALPDYVTAHPDETATWDVVFDQRGHLTEPHTRRSVPLGTLPVREYIGEREPIGPAVSFAIDTRFPTKGPEHRYGDVLFIEKEGFDPLIEAARIAERFDIAIMSTKGMSVVAARRLLDKLAPLISGRVLVLHDFDLSGFSIAGTLATDSRRYEFEHDVEMVDLGLRLEDVRRLNLQSEPVPLRTRRGEDEHEDEGLEARAETLREHGADEDEIDFLLGYDGEGPKRVELNAMTSDVFVAFLEQKLIEHGVKKIVPGKDVLQQHARRLIEQQLTEEALDELRDEIAEKAAGKKLPRDLDKRVRKLLAERPELSWDMATAMALGIDPS